MVWSDVYLCVFCSTAYATPTSYCSWSVHWISQNRSARRLELRKYVFRIQKIAPTGLGGSVWRGHSVSQSCPALSCWPPCGLAWLIAPKYSNPGQGRRLFLFIWHHLPFSTLLCHWASCPGRLAGLASLRLGPAHQRWPGRGFAGPMAAWGLWATVTLLQRWAASFWRALWWQSLWANVGSWSGWEAGGGEPHRPPPQGSWALRGDRSSVQELSGPVCLTSCWPAENTIFLGEGETCEGGGVGRRPP